MSRFAVDNNLDGIEYDLEDIQPGFTFPGVPDLYDWMRRVNATTKSIIGQDRFLSHAPQTPYLCVPGTPQGWPGALGGYYKVYKDANGAIDWLSLQMYNQGNGYRTYDQCFVNSGTDFPGSSISQLYNNGQGIPLSALVFGTFMQQGDGSGTNDPVILNNWFTQAHAQYSWPIQTMVWQWHTTGSPLPAEWLRIIYGI